MSIKRVSHSKTLGIIIDDKLLWKNQIEAIVTKASRDIGMLRRMKKAIAPKDTLITVYNALILPYFEYDCLGWDTCSAREYLLQKLHKNVK